MSEFSQQSLFSFENPEMPVFDVSRCVARIINYETAFKMVLEFHYAHRIPNIILAIGLYIDNVLSGCCTFGKPPNRDLFSSFGDEHKNNGIELNRLFIHDWAGRNSESWLISQSLQILRETFPEYYIVVSYADPTHDHFGTIYQATNWIYTGTTQARKHIELDGKVYHEREFGRTFDNIKQVERLGGMVRYSKPKHRYFYFLGSKKQKKQLRQLLKWPILPYPKRNNNV